MAVKEASKFKVNPNDFKMDRTLSPDRGWHKMDMRWLVTEKSQDSEFTVVGKTILPPGIGSSHSLHRHPDAEEWEYVIHGHGIKHVGDESFYVNAGELAFVPRNVYHALENASETEPLITIWGYSGAPSLEKAGYVVPEDEPDARKVKQVQPA